MVTIIQSVILGILEGITEWLPISSTGHMILADRIMGINENAAFADMFLVVIQLGAILAVLASFLRQLNPWSRTKNSLEKRHTYSLWGKIIVGCLPAAILGLLLDDTITKYLYGPLTVAITLVVYGVAFIVLERWNKTRRPKLTHLHDVTYKTALFIGMFQVLSLIPGTSRSGATILGAMILGCSRSVSAEYSFFLAIPVMFGASALKLYKFAGSNSFTSEEAAALIIGMVVAFCVSIFAIRFLMNFIRKHDFAGFGVYRIILGVVVIVAFGALGQL